MDAITPPPLTIDALDRDELLALVRRYLPVPGPSELWRARWDVAANRADAAFTAESEASDRWARACMAHVKTRPGSDEGKEAAKARDQAREQLDKATQAHERADAARKRVWRILEACR